MFEYYLIAVTATVLCLVLGFFYLGVARSAGWMHYRSFSVIPLIGAAYGFLAITAIQRDGSHYLAAGTAALTFVLGLLSGVAWLNFDAARCRRHLDVFERASRIILLLGIALCLFPNLVFGGRENISETWFGLTYQIPKTTLLAKFLIAVWLMTMARLTLRLALRASRKGDSWLCAGACGVFVLGGVADSLVATGAVSWPFLGLPAYALSTVLMALDLVDRIVGNARNLDRLNEHLRVGTEERSEVLLGVRRSLVLTERHAAVGKLATGISHEVNNPLSYIGGNLEYIRDEIVAGGRAPGSREVLAAISDALVGVEDIRKVVDELASYARDTPAQGGHSVATAVAVACRIVGQRAPFVMQLELNLHEVPDVAMDESGLAQILVTLLVDIAAVGRGAGGTGATRISLIRDKNFAEIEISTSRAAPRVKAAENREAAVGRSGPGESHEAEAHGISHCHFMIADAGGSLDVRPASASPPSGKWSRRFQIRLPLAKSEAS